MKLQGKEHNITNYTELQCTYFYSHQSVFDIPGIYKYLLLNQNHRFLLYYHLLVAHF
mgnify:CR=1 FL=1